MISVIIPFYERIAHLRCCLDALRNCSDDFHEVIVTDDGSRDETVSDLKDMVSQYPFPVRHVWQTRAGFRVAAARNNGIRQAKGEYLIFLDCDLLVLEDTIKHHRRLAKPGRFVAGHCKYLTENQSAKVLQAGVSPALLEELYRESSDREIVTQHRRFIKRTMLMRLHLVGIRKQSLGGHFSIHRQDIEYVNGYDENFLGWGGEDEDLGIRLVKAGIYGRSGIRDARALHLWHPKELGESHWTEGPNVAYFRRQSRPFYCKNGLRKSDCDERKGLR